MEKVDSVITIHDISSATKSKKAIVIARVKLIISLLNRAKLITSLVTP